MPIAKLHYKKSLIIKYSTEYVYDNKSGEGISSPCSANSQLESNSLAEHISPFCFIWINFAFLVSCHIRLCLQKRPYLLTSGLWIKGISDCTMRLISKQSCLVPAAMETSDIPLCQTMSF